MKTIVGLCFALLLISFASAVTICEDPCYAGETYFINATESFDQWSFVGNENNMTPEDFIIVQDPNTFLIEVTLNKYMKSDSFELVFSNREVDVVVEYRSSGSSGGGSSGGTRTKYVDRNIIEYVDNDIITEVPGETIETEKIIKSSKWWLVLWTIIGLVVGIIGYSLIFNRIEKEEKINEYE